MLPIEPASVDASTTNRRTDVTSVASSHCGLAEDVDANVRPIRKWLCHLGTAECLLDLDPACAHFRKLRGLLLRQRRPDEHHGATRVYIMGLWKNVGPLLPKCSRCCLARACTSLSPSKVCWSAQCARLCALKSVSDVQRFLKILCGALQ